MKIFSAFAYILISFLCISADPVFAQNELEYEDVNYAEYIKDQLDISVQSSLDTLKEGAIYVTPSCPDACETYNLTAACQSKAFAELTPQLKSFATQFKNVDELDDFFYKYRGECNKLAFTNYTSQYKEYINVAAKEFGVPEIMLACLLFSESQFFKSKKSPAGAEGIAQIMPNTAKTISNIIGMTPLPREAFKKYYSILYNFSEAKALTLKPAAREQYYADYELSKKIIKHYSLSQNWRKYIDSLKTSNAFKAEYRSVPWTEAYPTKFDMERAKIPPLAIGAAALYLKTIMLHLGKGREGSLKNKPDQMLNFLTAVTGAYNMGPGTASKLIGSPPSGDASQWVSKLSKHSPETNKHMLNIKNCMEKKNKTPPYEQQKTLVEQTQCKN